jgi:hypothetical protein
MGYSGISPEYRTLASVKFEFTRARLRMAFLAGLLVIASLTAGYATAGGGNQNPVPLVPPQLTAVRAQPSGDVSLARLRPTSRLQPVGRRTQSVATQAPAQTPQTPVVQQPVRPTPTPQPTPEPTPQRPARTPSTGNTNTFDSSG